jgi:ABC-type multidrug transport system ATPase subunit
MLKSLDVLVFIEPTRGVDVGAKTELYSILEELADQGKAIVVISTDTTEILQLSDRIFVMVDGRIHRVLEGRTDDETLMRLISGQNGKEGERMTTMRVDTRRLPASAHGHGGMAGHRLVPFCCSCCSPFFPRSSIPITT